MSDPSGSNRTADFLATVKPAFDFLVTDYGWTLEQASNGESVDDGSARYRGKNLSVVVTRDRGQVLLAVGGNASIGQVDAELLRAIIAGRTRYVLPTSPEPFTAEFEAAFLRAELPTLERLFEPSRAEGTMALARQLGDDRAELMFGNTIG